MPIYYYAVIVILGIGNLVLAVVAYFQRSKQLHGNQLREHQVALAEARNGLAELRLERLNDQVVLLADIRAALCNEGNPRQQVAHELATRSNGHSKTRLTLSEEERTM